MNFDNFKFPDFTDPKTLGKICLGIVACAGLGFVIKKGINCLKSTVEKSQNKTVVDNKNLTINEFTANNIATSLYNAMASTGTDETTIKAQFDRIKTADDLKLVHNAFGTRPYGTYGAPLYSWLPSTNKNLHDWLREELSSSALNQYEPLFAAANL